MLPTFWPRKKKETKNNIYLTEVLVKVFVVNFFSSDLSLKISVCNICKTNVGICIFHMYNVHVSSH